MSHIFAIGNTNRKQASRRSDGQWFYRARYPNGYWGRWTKCNDRPEHAWYDPLLGSAKLPPADVKLTETEIKENDMHTITQKHKSTWTQPILTGVSREDQLRETLMIIQAGLEQGAIISKRIAVAGVDGPARSLSEIVNNALEATATA